jgi:hypothetical protein
MLPATINGIVGEYALVQCTDPKYRGQLVTENMEVRIDQDQPPSWQASTLLHELTHLAFELCRGVTAPADDREEPACEVLGRLLAKVLIDNPALLDFTADICQVDIIGEIWKVGYMREPSEDEPGTIAWIHSRTQTLRCRDDVPVQLQRLRLFQMVGQATLAAGGIKDCYDPYYWNMFSSLYALLRANPGAHPKAVIAGG